MLNAMQIRTTRTYRFRCHPTKSRISRLENQFSMCRHLYNWSLKDRIETYQETGSSVGYVQQAGSLPALKENRPWFKSVHSQVLQNVLKRLDEGFKAFFRRVKEGPESPGFPKFKKKGCWNSITYPQYSKLPEIINPERKSKSKNSIIKAPKIGTIKTTYHREIPDSAVIKTLSIVKEAGKWFACFSAQVLVELEPKHESLPPVGIDMGLIDFLYTSDGDNVPVPKYLRKKEKQLKRLQQRLSAAEKRTPKYDKLLRALQKCHYRIKCRRKDFLHKQANHLLDLSDCICHEKLSIRNMIRRPKPKADGTGGYLPNGASAKAGLNKSIADVGWFGFFEILKYKAASLGKTIIPVAPAYTSQACSACGAIVKKTLSTRTHRCPACGYTANRDLNAAINILRIGLDTLQASNLIEAHLL
jgi:putative transposase